MSVGDLYARVMGDRTTMRLKEFRHRCILEALAACQGNVSRAAAHLGVHHNTVLYHKQREAR